jgi:tetratricopeptide (TPR) repeat protein
MTEVKTAEKSPAGLFVSRTAMRAVHCFGKHFMSDPTELSMRIYIGYSYLESAKQRLKHGEIQDIVTAGELLLKAMKLQRGKTCYPGLAEEFVPLALRIRKRLDYIEGAARLCLALTGEAMLFADDATKQDLKGYLLSCLPARPTNILAGVDEELKIKDRVWRYVDSSTVRDQRYCVDMVMRELALIRDYLALNFPSEPVPEDLQKMKAKVYAASACLNVREEYFDLALDDLRNALDLDPSQKDELHGKLADACMAKAESFARMNVGAPTDRNLAKARKWVERAIGLSPERKGEFRSKLADMYLWQAEYAIMDRMYIRRSLDFLSFAMVNDPDRENGYRSKMAGWFEEKAKWCEENHYHPSWIAKLTEAASQVAPGSGALHKLLER